MKDVLDTVNHRRPIGTLDDIHNTLETKEIGTAVLGERFQEERQRRSPNRLLAHERIGLDVGIMASVSVGFFRQPRDNVDRFGLRIVETGIKDDQWIDRPWSAT